MKADLRHSTRSFVFTTVRGKHLRRSGFQRRLWTPAVNGGRHAGENWAPVRRGLTFHGLRHAHKTWLIEDGIPDVAQARRLGHTLDNKIDEITPTSRPASKPASSPHSKPAGSAP